MQIRTKAFSQNVFDLCSRDIYIYTYIRKDKGNRREQGTRNREQEPLQENPSLLSRGGFTNESWEGSGIVINSDTVMGMGREGKGNREYSYGKKICRREPANFFVTLAAESKKVFARILDEF